MTKKYVMRAVVGALVGMLGLLVVPALAAASGPQFGKSFQATPVSGTVKVTVGGHTAKLTHQRLVPDGSTFYATNGIVRLSVANGTGGTYSGQFTKGDFQAQQSKTNPATAIKLVGPCTSALVASDHQARAAHRARVYRNLQATAPPDFLVIGQSGQAHATTGTAKYTLSDACKSSSSASAAATNAPKGTTQVHDHSGHVLASSTNGRVQRTIDAGAVEQFLCSAAHGYCVGVELETKGSLHSYFYPAVATNKPAGTFQFCLTSPVKRTCSTVASNDPVFEHGSRFSGGLAVLACRASQPGNYSASWLMHGVALGSPLKFHVSSSTAGVPCYGFEGNIDANPLPVTLNAYVQAVSRVSLPFAVSIRAMYLSLAPTGNPGRQVFRGVIYADRGGRPGKLLGVTEPLTFSAKSQANNSIALGFPSRKGCAFLQFCNHLAAGKYWVGVWASGQPKVATIGADPLAGSGASSSAPSSQGPTNPFGPFIAENYYLAVRFDYVPSS